MPDNRKTGALEDSLPDLIDRRDRLRRAVLHTWLAWQEESGPPYCVAIRARYFGGESAAMEQFVTPFQRVVGVPAQPQRKINAGFGGGPQTERKPPGTNEWRTPGTK